MTEKANQYLTTGGNDPFLPKLVTAINKATRIDIAVAFIRSSGLGLLQQSLLDALSRNPKTTIRIITGDYLDITEPVALRRLMLLKEEGAQVKIFETGGAQSFHMKAYIFLYDQNSGTGSAFVGSSNISSSALQEGLEWNLHVEKEENEERFNEISDNFSVLFNNQKSVELDHAWIDRYQQKYQYTFHKEYSLEEEEIEKIPPPIPNEVQSEALLSLSKTRNEGFTRGLVVLATGMGKTWLAAFDVKAMNAKRVLFVAHREEILMQAESTFLTIQPDAKVGRYTGEIKQTEVDFLFASIQTMGKAGHLLKFDAGYFDYIVMDEFHHAAASTYRRLLSHFEPRFLLGLTATPDRTDQSDILSLCDDNLVYIRDLFFGINSKILSPFSYFGVSDETVDYKEIPWRNGKFDPEALLHQLATQARAKHVLSIWKRHKQSRTLAFCISQKHADFMADYFNRNGIKAVSVHSESDVRRNSAIESLEKNQVDVVFSVDLFNEGVDVPSIDTVLMLRPTESKIIFLQQLGRGLRKSPDTEKERLIVVDFIGNHISFFRKAEALFKVEVTNKSRKEFLDTVKQDNLPLPDGCFINYDIKAIEFLENLIPSVDTQESIYKSLKQTLDRRPSLTEFYRGSGNVIAIRKQYGQWFHFVDELKDLDEDQKTCLEKYNDLFREVETTALTKSFKLILLDAFIELNGFSQEVSTSQLAMKSYKVINRKRTLLVDLPDEYQDKKLFDLKKWQDYWLKNPINAWIGGNAESKNSYFYLENENFRFKDNIEESLLDVFENLLQEIINFRYLQYEERLVNRGEDLTPVAHEIKKDGTKIPYFTDLKIACGYFRTSEHESENIELRILPLSYGNLDPGKHFIARAKGDSMDGGLSPIKNGDYLLLERISTSNAGSNDGRIIAIERQDTSGDDQYLLRKVHKTGEGQYELIAQNTDYSKMMANEEMATFARLKSVVDVEDLFLHEEFYKPDVPDLFGLEYLEGLWKMSGHVTPKNTNDQFLFVTLNKRNADKDYLYHDYFKDESHFHWQSQNKTTPDSVKGKGIIDSPGTIYLFVRKFGKIRGKAAPFLFCGCLKYLNHSGSGPIDVDFELISPLPDHVFEQYKIS